MAQVIKIKRSTVTSAPTSLSQGELAYSQVSKKLFIGQPGGTSGDILTIGGQYYTEVADNLVAANAITLSGDVTGTSTYNSGTGVWTIATTIAANSITLGTDTTGDYVESLVAGALIDLANNSGEGATPTISVDLSELTDMTESAVGTDELVILDAGLQRRKAINEIPLGIFNTANQIALGTDTTGSYVASVADAGNTNIAVTGTGESAAVTLDLTTTGVTANSYGSSTSIPTFTVDSYGRLTAAGSVSIATSLIIQSDDAVDNTVALATDKLLLLGGTGLTSTNTGDAVTFNLDNTAVSPGSYGSSTSVPTFTVDQQGRLTAAGSANIATTLNITGDSGTDAVALLTETLNFEGGTGVTTTVTDDNVAFAIGQDVATTANVTFNDVTVNGTLNSNDITSANISVDGNATITGNLTVNGTTTTVNSTTVTVDDIILTLGGDTAPSSDDNLDRGIEFRWHDGSAAKLGFFGLDDSTGEFTYIPQATNTGNVISGTAGAAYFGSLKLDTDLIVSYGGTGRSTFTTNGIVYGNGTSPLGVTAAGTWDATHSVGQILSVNAAGTPTWTNTLDGGSF